MSPFLTKILAGITIDGLKSLLAPVAKAFSYFLAYRKGKADARKDAEIETAKRNKEDAQALNKIRDAQAKAASDANAIDSLKKGKF